MEDTRPVSGFLGNAFEVEDAKDTKFQCVNRLEKQPKRDWGGRMTIAQFLSYLDQKKWIIISIWLKKINKKLHIKFMSLKSPVFIHCHNKMLFNSYAVFETASFKNPYNCHLYDSLKGNKGLEKFYLK